MLIDPNNPIIDWLLPRRCLVCIDDLAYGLICQACRSFCNLCPNQTAFSGDRLGAFFYFELSMRKVILEAKFKRSSAALHLLTNLI